jgi:hypothetical protein
MYNQAARFVLIAATAAMAWTQTPERVFYLTNTGTSQQFQEVLTTIRAVADVKPASVSVADRSFTLQATDEQIKLVDWLVNELNRAAPEPPPAPQPQNSTAHEYRVAGADDVVRVFYITWSRQPQDLQEIATITRSVVGIRQLFTYTTLKAMTVRGTAAQVAIAEWLVNELNKPVRAGTAAAPNPNLPHEYRIPGGNEESVRIFYLANRETPRELMEVAVALREGTGIERLLVNDAQKAIAARGTPDQMASAERLVHNMDQPKAQ